MGLMYMTVPICIMHAIIICFCLDNACSSIIISCNYKYAIAHLMHVFLYKHDFNYISWLGSGPRVTLHAQVSSQGSRRTYHLRILIFRSRPSSNSTFVEFFPCIYFFWLVHVYSISLSCLCLDNSLFILLVFCSLRDIISWLFWAIHYILMIYVLSYFLHIVFLAIVISIYVVLR